MGERETLLFDNQIEVKLTFLRLNVVTDEQFGEKEMHIIKKQKDANGRHRVHEAAQLDAGESSQQASFGRAIQFVQLDRMQSEADGQKDERHAKQKALIEIQTVQDAAKKLLAFERIQLLQDQKFFACTRLVDLNEVLLEKVN